MRAAMPLPRPAPSRWRWPATAGLSWAAAWAATVVAARSGLPAAVAMAVGLAVAALPALAGRRLGVDTAWRRLYVIGGYPLLLAATGLAHGLPGWVWAVPLALLAMAYPVSAWRDAPVFPTPAGALAGLPERLALPAQPRLHDAGCGLGQGLQALRAAWPDARVSGVERSGALALACRLRCPWARVQRGDMWRAGWQDLDAVYLFQRPESMARAMAKAQAEMAPGAWLISLEFVVPGRAPDVTVFTGDGRPVHAWRIAGNRTARNCSQEP